MEHFTSSTEEIKTTASYALGALAAGNVSKYLPILLNEIKTQAKRQYLLLHALKEVISSQDVQIGISDIFRNGIGDIWNMLVSHCKAPEESIRNIVAECLGKLCKIEPAKFLPQLIQMTQNGDSLERGCAVTAARFMIVSSSPLAEQYLHQNLGQILKAIDDNDLTVRRTAIMTLNAAAHNRPRWVKELLPELLPSLYRETFVNKELIHEVEMGPFKHVSQIISSSFKSIS
jgi:cullin-associated NEDD8-dissociated protein 1